MSLPLGVQFNNPLNVRPDGKSNWQGVIAIEQTPSGSFLHFDAPPKGWRCAAGNVIAHFDRWGHNTIAGLIGGTGTRGQPDYRPGWAPKEDRNDPDEYIKSVVKDTGFAANAVLNFHSYAHLKPVLVAMAKVEQGKSPYTWWNDEQINWGLEQYGVVPPPSIIKKAGPIVGTVTAATTAAGTAITPSYPPPVPTVPVPPASPSVDPSVVIEHAQTLLQQIAPYVKWGGIALMVLLAAGFAWHWWNERKKRKQGVS